MKTNLNDTKVNSNSKKNIMQANITGTKCNGCCKQNLSDIQ